MLCVDNEWMDGELQGIIDSALRNANDDESLLSIAPRPLNWDLKRDLAPSMDTLAEQTQAAIRECIRKQIEAQKAKDEDDSSSGSSSGSDSDDEEKMPQA